MTSPSLQSNPESDKASYNRDTRSMQGGKPSATAVNERRSFSNGPNSTIIYTFGEHGHVQTSKGQALGAGGLGRSAHTALEPPFIPADEPPSATGNGNKNIRRGRQVPAKAATLPVYNPAQALALLQSESVGKEKISYGNSWHSSVATANPEGIEEGASVQGTWYEEVTREEPIRIYQRRFFPKIFSISTLIDRFSRFPRRIGTDPTPIFYPTTDEEVVQAFSTPPIDENENELPRTSKGLLGGLHRGALKPQLIPPTLFILVISITHDNQKDDPQHDLNVMQELLDNRHSDRIHFRSISGERATLRAIKEAVSELYREALESSDPNILILLTGEGDAENKIRLKGDGTTTGEGLWRWMRELQIDSYPKSRTVTIILDHCHPKVIPSGEWPRLGDSTLAVCPSPIRVAVELTWTCSSGQMATALRFPTTPNIPRSCFLLAVMMASCSVHNGGRSNLVININKELNRLLRFLEFAHKTIHGDPDRQCIHCSKNERCPMPPPRPQVPDWERAGSMKSVYNLVDRLSNMDFVSQVRDRFMGNRFFREANGLPAEDATFQPNPNSSHQAGQMSHIQGLSKPVDSGPTIQTGPH